MDRYQTSGFEFFEWFVMLITPIASMDCNNVRGFE